MSFHVDSCSFDCILRFQMFKYPLAEQMVCTVSVFSAHYGCISVQKKLCDWHLCVRVSAVHVQILPRIFWSSAENFVFLKDAEPEECGVSILFLEYVLKMAQP